MNPHGAIDRDFAAHLERIREFLRIPSVSAGGRAEPREPGERRPAVIGVIDGPGPTVRRLMHVAYDALAGLSRAR